MELSQSCSHCPKLCPALETPCKSSPDFPVWERPGQVERAPVQQPMKHTQEHWRAGGNPEEASDPSGLDREVVREGCPEEAASELSHDG